VSIRKDWQQREVEDEVGHPDERWRTLLERVQDGALGTFAAVERDWLDLMWCLDAYRIAQVPPRGMGKPTLQPNRRLEAVYRSKGRWFARLLAALLQQRTAQVIAPKPAVEGFSQYHKIDLAWPDRDFDLEVCALTRVTGAPARGSDPSRPSLADWTNRRKELKFAATDLKMYPADEHTHMPSWDAWRRQQTPHTFFFWAARLATDSERRRDTVAALSIEAAALTATYLDGAAVFAWRERGDGRGYEAVGVPMREGVGTIDDVLDVIEAVIRRAVGPDGAVSPGSRPMHRAVGLEDLAADRRTEDQQAD
jgi:hypothetical protein